MSFSLSILLLLQLVVLLNVGTHKHLFTTGTSKLCLGGGRKMIIFNYVTILSKWDKVRWISYFYWKLDRYLNFLGIYKKIVFFLWDRGINHMFLTTIIIQTNVLDSHPTLPKKVMIRNYTPFRFSHIEAHVN